jgi:RNA polymerase-binding transcription factor DksA
MSLDTARGGSPAERISAYEARQRLEHERAARLAQLDALNEAEPAADGVLASQKNAVRRTLSGIDDAFARLDDDSYGTCQTCTQPIPATRLEIPSYTRCCVTCQQRTG